MRPFSEMPPGRVNPPEVENLHGRAEELGTEPYGDRRLSLDDPEVRGEEVDRLTGICRSAVRHALRGDRVTYPARSGNSMDFQVETPTGALLYVTVTRVSPERTSHDGAEDPYRVPGVN